MSTPIVHVIGTGGSISCIGAARTDFLDYSYGDRHYTIQEMLDLLGSVYPRDEIVVGDLGAVIGAHGGPRTMGITFQLPAG